MARKNQGKPRLSLVHLMPKATASLVDVMQWGEEKYSPVAEKGWLKYQPEEVLDSLARHMAAIIGGETIDPESGQPHADHIVFNACVYRELIGDCSFEGSGEQTPPEGLIES